MLDDPCVKEDLPYRVPAYPRGRNGSREPWVTDCYNDDVLVFFVVLVSGSKMSIASKSNGSVVRNSWR